MSCDCNTLVVGEAGVQGPQGLAGINGTNGTNGINAFTTVTTNFVQPSTFSSVTIVVGSNQWVAVGQTIYIQQAGFYTVTSLSGTTQIVCTLEQQAGVAPLGTVTAGSKVSPSAIATYAAPLTQLTVSGTSIFYNGPVNINTSGATANDVTIGGVSDNSLFVADVSANRIGVGTSSPAAKLHISGTLKVGNSSTGGSAEFTGGAIFNSSQASNNDFIVKTALLSNTLFVQTSSDKVGIGTNSPSKLLDVNGAAEMNSLLVNPGGVNAIDGSNYVFRVLGSGTTYPISVNASTNFVGVFVSSPTTQLDVSGSSKISGNLIVDTSTLFVDATNNRVGINNASPASTLDVIGSTNISGNVSVSGTLSVTGTFSTAVLAYANSGLNVTGNTSISNNLDVGGNVLVVDSSANTVGINGTPVSTNALQVFGGNFAVDSTTLFVDATNNRVGINTSSTTHDLHVLGDAKITDSFTVGTSTFIADSTLNTVVVNTSTQIDSGTLSVLGPVSISGYLNRKGVKTVGLTPYTVENSDTWLSIDAGSTAVLVLPNYASNQGRELHVKTIGAYAVYSSGSVISSISGVNTSSIVTNTAGKWATLVVNNSSSYWEVMAQG